MKFTKDSGLVKTWISLVLCGVFTLEQVPNLFNLKSVVSEVIRGVSRRSGMIESIITAIITGGLALIGVVYSSNKSSHTMDLKLDKQQAITETKLDELTREVREHNNFAKRMPVVEEQIKVINHRISDLEKFHKGA